MQVDRQEDIRLEGLSEFPAVAMETSAEVLASAKLIAPPCPQEADRAAPVRMVCVIDRSGSMEGAKLALVKQTMEFVVSQLKPADEMGIVTYESGVKIDLRMTQMDSSGKRAAESAIQAIQTDGCTFLSGGLMTGINLLRGIEKVEVAPSDNNRGMMPRRVRVPPSPRRPSGLPLPDSKTGKLDALFLIGNDHELIPEDQAKDSQTSPNKNQHKWTMFVRGDHLACIDTVTFELHPTFKPNNISCSGPFEVTRTGWGVFEVGVEIQFKSYYSMAPYRCKHMLSFDGSGAARQVTVTLTDAQAVAEIQQKSSSSSIFSSIVSSISSLLPASLTSSSSSSAISNQPSSVLLFTDGLANVGLQNTLEIVSQMQSLLRECPFPCNVFTFGFGADHNPEMLNAIAEAGQGMYYFIENAENIPLAFADCLGGLASLVAQDITLHIEPNQAGIEIVKVLSRYDTVRNANGSYMVKFQNVYGDEERNVPFLVKLLAVPEPIVLGSEKSKIINLKVTSKNSITKAQAVATSSVQVGRKPSASLLASDRVANVSLDEQRNRLLALDAMEEARSLPDSQLAKARDIINAAIKTISTSQSSQTRVCLGLIADLRDCLVSMESVQEYRSVGTKKMMSKANAHYKERSAGMNAGSAYANSSKSAMIAAYKG